MITYNITKNIQHILITQQVEQNIINEHIEHLYFDINQNISQENNTNYDLYIFIVSILLLYPISIPIFITLLLDKFNIINVQNKYIVILVLIISIYFILLTFCYIIINIINIITLFFLIFFLYT